MSAFTVYHTNDFHNHLRSDQVAKLAAARRLAGPLGLLLDAGDAVASGNITYTAAGEPILDAMSDAGYDAMTVGNREFHFSEAGFTAKLARARFPVLCANVRPARPLAPAALPVKPYAFFSPAPDWRILVLGVTVPMITERMLVRKLSAYVFDDPIETAARILPGLQQRYDPSLTIILSHIGIASDRKLAEHIAGVDLIIGGHTHLTLPEGERVAGALIVQAGWFGRSFGTVVATRDSAGSIALKAKVEDL